MIIIIFNKKDKKKWHFSNYLDQTPNTSNNLASTLTLQIFQLITLQSKLCRKFSKALNLNTIHSLHKSMILKVSKKQSQQHKLRINKSAKLSTDQPMKFMTAHHQVKPKLHPHVQLVKCTLLITTVMHAFPATKLCSQANIVL